MLRAVSWIVTVLTVVIIAGGIGYNIYKEYLLIKIMRNVSDKPDDVINALKKAAQ